MLVLPARWRLKNAKSKAGMLVDMLGSTSDDERYRLLVSHWRDPASVVLGAVEPSTAWNRSGADARLRDSSEQMMFNDLVGYLPDDILTKVDRASMAVGLEARVPLLDHRVVEFAWRVPMHQKVRDGHGKWLLRQVLHRYVPSHLIDRPKQGFSGPVGDWLRGPLREWAESLLAVDRLAREGFFHPESIRRVWALHLTGKSDQSRHLWGVLMFQAWLEGNSGGA